MEFSARDFYRTQTLLRLSRISTSKMPSTNVANKSGMTF
jgi:hypothetical protein